MHFRGFKLLDLTYAKEVYLDRFFRALSKSQKEVSEVQGIEYREVLAMDVVEAYYDKWEDSKNEDNKFLHMVAFAWENIEGMKGLPYEETILQLYLFLADFRVLKELLKKK